MQGELVNKMWPETVNEKLARINNYANEETEKERNLKRLDI